MAATLFCLALVMPLGPAGATEWTGRFRVDSAVNLSLVDWYSLGSRPADTSLVELARLRLTGLADYGYDWTVEAAYELNARGGTSRSVFGDTENPPTRLRITDLNRELIGEDDFSLSQNLDRLRLTANRTSWVVTLGRQAIGQGSGRLFNPSDIFAPVSPYTTYSEYKAGVDALRVTRPMGEDLELELIAVAHDNGWDQAYYLGRAKKLFSGWDASILAGYSLGLPTMALDASADVAGAGVYGEAVMRLDDDPASSLRAMIGVQYHFQNKIDLIVEGHYNGPGRLEPEQSAAVALTPAWRNGEIFLTGRWYLAVLVGYEFHPLVNGTAAVVANPIDGSCLVQPGVVWDALENMTVKLGASLGLGRRPDVLTNPFIPGLEIAVSRSEFGTYPNIYYLEATYTF